MRAGFETKQFIKFMCVHFGRIINCDRICIEFRVDKFYQHKFFGCDIKIYWCVLMPRLNESVGDRSSLFNLKQGKSEGFESCDRPSNLTEIGFKSSIFIRCNLEI